MKPIDIVNPGDVMWTIEEDGLLRMIQVDHIYYDQNEDEDLKGWNIIYKDEEYYLECCFKMEYVFTEN